MYCIHSISTDVYFNLAAEEYLLKRSPGDFFILWKSDPAVIVGKHQNVFAEVNLDFVNENQIKLARRYSGGGTVYHDLGNLNLTFIETSPTADFDKFTGWIMKALSFYNLDVSRDERRGIYIDGLKISGSAQCMYKNRILYHATLLFDSNLGNLISSLEVSTLQPADASNKYYVRSVKSPVTNIAHHIQQPIDMESFQDFVMNHFLKKEVTNVAYAFSERDLSEINLLRNDKYAKREWYFNTL